MVGVRCGGKFKRKLSTAKLTQDEMVRSSLGPRFLGCDNTMGTKLPRILDKSETAG